MRCETGKLWTQCPIFPEAKLLNWQRENLGYTASMGWGVGIPCFVCVRVFLPFSFPLEDCFALNLPSFRIICSRLKLKLNISFCRALDLLANEI